MAVIMFQIIHAACVKILPTCSVIKVVNPGTSSQSGDALSYLGSKDRSEFILEGRERERE